MRERLLFVATSAVEPALKLLPAAMSSDEARVLLYAIGLQESRLVHRYQILQNRPGVQGPARGLWQFERGSQMFGGGVWGVFKHKASRYWLSELCKARGVPFDPPAIWERLEGDDVLAAGVARLLLFTDPKRLPALTDTKGAWDLYRFRTWRPGKPHAGKWPLNHRMAVAAARAHYA